MALLPSLQTGAAAEVPRRYLVVSLPTWATDCLRRDDPALADATAPLALWERERGAMRLAATDARAQALGIVAGMNLSDARAQVPALVAREIDRVALIRRFEDFADWHSWASPMVSIEASRAPYGELVLDITGVSHLFGGEAAMLARVTGRLAALGFAAQGAIAGAIGAAWALARHAPGAVIAGNGARAALGELPVEALRLDAWQVLGLTQLGLRRIGQLYGRERKGLRARFGDALVLRLDQALGDVEEKPAPRLPPVEHFAERRFAEPIGLMDDVLACAGDLSIRLAAELEAAGEGAQTFHLFLYRVDHKLMHLAINAARPTRDAKHIAGLFSHRAERLGGEYDAGFGIDMVRLAASSTSPLGASQLGVFARDSAGEDLAQLYDRMASRLGAATVLGQKFVNTHIPEQAVVLEPVVVASPADPEARPDASLPRPVRLLPAPEPITVTAEVPDGPPVGMTWRRVGYRFARASGPERIGVDWWGGDFTLSTRRLKPNPRPLPLNKRREGGQGMVEEIVRHPVSARDYYVAEDEGGRRFWLFRQGLYGEAGTPAWYMHGFFA